MALLHLKIALLVMMELLGFHLHFEHSDFDMDLDIGLGYCHRVGMVLALDKLALVLGSL